MEWNTYIKYTISIKKRKRLVTHTQGEGKGKGKKFQPLTDNYVPN